MAEESFLGQLKRLIVGARIPSHLAHHERFSRVTGLAVLSSDALSSVAYATEEILRVLAVGGLAALRLVTPIGAVIAVVLAVVVFSYRQTIHAYPGGGGAYIVAKENLGRAPSLVAAASLLIDYVLTVAVSVAAAMDALVSLEESVRPVAVPLAVFSVLCIMLINLRGMRESGTIFSIPTYAFVGALGLAIVVGLMKVFADGENPLAAGAAREPVEVKESLGLFLILKIGRAHV